MEKISYAAAIHRYFNAPSPISGPVVKCTTVEIKQFLDALKAEGTAPLTLLRVDPVSLGSWARATKGTVLIPGVRVSSGTSVAARAS